MSGDGPVRAGGHRPSSLALRTIGMALHIFERADRQLGSRVRPQVVAPSIGICRIDRNECGARAQHSMYCENGVNPDRHLDGDQIAATNICLSECLRDLCDPFVHLASGVVLVP